MIHIDHAQKALEKLNSVSEQKWVLLDLDEASGRGLVVSKDVIQQMPYDYPGNCAVTWDKCSSRRWLNSEFFDSLPEAVKEKAIRSKIVTEDNCGIPGGEDTEDYVFLLSIREYNDCLPENLRAANLNGVPSWYWLRSPGYAATDVANVMPNGALDGGLKGHGFYSHCDCGGIRPAMYLDLN